MTTLSDDYQHLVDTCLQTYPSVPRNTLQYVASRLQRACADVHALVSKNILDVGCGAEKNGDQPNFVQWALSGFRKVHECKPWYCRMASIAGAKNVKGIDIADNSTEPFTGIQADLRDLRVLEEMKDGTIDIVNNNLFTNPPNAGFGILGFSPSLQHLLRGRDSSGTFQERLWNMIMGKGVIGLKERNPQDDAMLIRYNEKLFEQIARLLAEGGAYTFGPCTYHKKSGQLIDDEEQMNDLGRNV